MPLSPGFVDFVGELIADFGRFEVKRMFGGAMLLREGVGFGILDNDVLFLKADTDLAADLKRLGCKAWSYSVKKDGTVRDVAYWSLPDSAADDPEEAVALVQRAYAVALRTAADKAPKTRRAVSAKKPAPKRAAIRARRKT